MRKFESIIILVLGLIFTGVYIYKGLIIGVILGCTSIIIGVILYLYLILEDIVSNPLIVLVSKGSIEEAKDNTEDKED